MLVIKPLTKQWSAQGGMSLRSEPAIVFAANRSTLKPYLNRL